MTKGGFALRLAITLSLLLPSFAVTHVASAAGFSAVIKGQVLFPDGMPAVGAEIEAYPAGDEDGIYPPGPTVLTDDSGNYSLPLATAGRYTVDILPSFQDENDGYFSFYVGAPDVAVNRGQLAPGQPLTTRGSPAQLGEVEAPRSFFAVHGATLKAGATYLRKGATLRPGRSDDCGYLFLHRAGNHRFSDNTDDPVNLDEFLGSSDAYRISYPLAPGNYSLLYKSYPESGCDHVSATSSVVEAVPGKSFGFPNFAPEPRIHPSELPAIVGSLTPGSVVRLSRSKQPAGLRLQWSWNSGHNADQAFRICTCAKAGDKITATLTYSEVNHYDTVVTLTAVFA